MRTGRAAASVPRRGLARASVGAALLLHAVVLWLLLPHRPGHDAAIPVDPPAIEVEMVDQAAETKGRPASDAGQPPQPQPSPPAPPSPPSAAPARPPPLPRAPSGDPVPPAAPAATAAPPGPPPPAPRRRPRPGAVRPPP